MIFLENAMENLNVVADLSQEKILKIIEHDSYSRRYFTISKHGTEGGGRDLIGLD